MTWAVTSPLGFGDFLPSCDYVGWKEAIEQVFANMSETEQAKYGNRPTVLALAASEKFTSDKGPLKDYEKPREIRLLEKPKSLADLVQARDRLLVVSAPLKAIIEDLEPNRHQFWPIRLSLPRNGETDTRYFGIVVRTFLDSFDRDASDPGSWEIRHDRPHVTEAVKKCFQGIALNPEIIGSAHLWRERDFRGADLFMSDALMERIASAKLRIPKAYRLKDVAR